MSKKLKVGIIGMGAIGSVHADAYQATGEADIEAICDIDAKQLAQKGDKLNVKNRFKDYHDLLKSDVEAVSICVGNALHREVAVAVLKAGKHILLEKPMALNVTEAADIVAATEQSGKVAQVGMVWRQSNETQVVREYIQSGLFGKIYHVRAVMIRRRGIPGLGGWFTTMSQSGGGPLIDLGVHWFDMAMWLSDCWSPKSVKAKTYAKFGPLMKDYKYVEMWAGPPKLDGVCDVEDYATGFVQLSDHATMNFDIAWAANAEEEMYVEIMGDKGGTRVLNGKPLQILTEHQGRVADIAPQFEQEELLKKFEAQAGKFIAACRGECPPAATVNEGLSVMKLLDAIYKSSEAGKEIEI